MPRVSSTTPIVTRSCANCGAANQTDTCQKCGAAEVCRTCGDLYPEGDDGYDGECPECADRTASAENSRGEA